MYTTDYTTSDCRAFEALQLTWDELETILGHRFAGDPEDERLIVAHLLANSAPGWVVDADGWIDELGWGLIGPEKPDDSE